MAIVGKSKSGPGNMNFDIASPVYVGGFKISVVDGTDELRDRGLDGFYNGRDSIVNIRTDCGPQLQALTYVHELVHAIECVYLEGQELTEVQVSALAQGLFQVLVDNDNVMQTIDDLVDVDDVCEDSVATVCGCYESTSICQCELKSPVTPEK